MKSEKYASAPLSIQLFCFFVNNRVYISLKGTAVANCSLFTIHYYLFRSFLYLFKQNVDLDGKHRREEDEEEEERDDDARRVQVAHGYPCGQHVLNGPGLASELGNEPSAL